MSGKVNVVNVINVVHWETYQKEEHIVASSTTKSKYSIFGAVGTDMPLYINVRGLAVHSFLCSTKVEGIFSAVYDTNNEPVIVCGK